MPDLLKKLAIAAVCISIAAAFSSCGRKGDLEAPGAYENQSTDAATGTAPAKQPARSDKPFILDPLL